MRSFGRVRAALAADPATVTGSATRPFLRFLVLGCLVGVASMVLAACAAEEPDEEIVARRAERSRQTVTIVYPEWSSEIASARLFEAVLRERLGYQVRLEAVEVEEMWRRVADGEADALVGAWLPVTHRRYYRRYGDRVEDLGPNLEGAKIGLVVPAAFPSFRTDERGRTGTPFVTTTLIPELADDVDRFGGRVIGIESGAGVVQRAHAALDAYELGDEYRIVESDEERMLQELDRALRARRWVVLTGWTPHWAFERYNLRFLDDPLEVFGGDESIHTMVREGLADELPDAYRLLDRIKYRPQDLERLMLWIREDDGRDPYAQAERWVRTHSEMVDAWVEGIE